MEHFFDDVLAGLPPTSRELLRASYFRAVSSNPDHPLRVRLRGNAVDRWRPDAPIRVYHSPDDEEVFFETCSCREGEAGMDLELAGRTAVVIGGSSGIGAAVAGVLAEEECVGMGGGPGSCRWSSVRPGRRPRRRDPGGPGGRARRRGAVRRAQGGHAVRPDQRRGVGMRSSRPTSAAPSSPCRRWRRWCDPGRANDPGPAGHVGVEPGSPWSRPRTRDRCVARGKAGAGPCHQAAAEGRWNRCRSASVG